MITPEQIAQFRQQAGLNPTPPAPVSTSANEIIARRKAQLEAMPEPNFGQKVGNIIQEGGEKFREGIERESRGEQTTLETAGQLVGQTGLAAGKILGEATKPIVEPAVDLFSKALFWNVPRDIKEKAGEFISEKTQELDVKYSSWAKENPRAAANLEAALGVASLPLTLQGADALATGAVNVVKSVPSGLKTLKGSAPSFSGNSKNRTWEMVKPKLTPSELNEAAQQGKVTIKGKLGITKQIPKGRDLEMIEVAHPYVSVAKNETDAIQKLKGAIAEEANKLKSGLSQSKAIWNQNELKGAISKVDRPHLLSGDVEKAFDKTLKVVIDKASTSDKKLGGLLDIRKAFDDVVESQYPNLYSSETLSPLKQAVLKTRAAINDLIENKLPAGTTVDGIPFKQSLKNQSMLYDAMENIKVPKIGSTKIDRALQSIKEHPAITAAGAVGAGYAAGKGLGL